MQRGVGQAAELFPALCVVRPTIHAPWAAMGALRTMGVDHLSPLPGHLAAAAGCLVCIRAFCYQDE